MTSCSPSLAHKVGEVALKSLRIFETHSRLLKKSDDHNSSIAQLEWSDIVLQDRVHVVLGNGVFSTVYLANIPPLNEKDTVRQHKIKINADSKKYAIKTVRKKNMADEEAFKISAVSLVYEAKILANIQHENIIQLHGVKAGCISKAFQGRGYFLVLERLQDRTLDQRLKKWRKYHQENSLTRLFTRHTVPSLPERIGTIALGLARAMEYLHSRMIMHRYGPFCFK